MDRKKLGWTTKMDPKRVTAYLTDLSRPELIDILRAVFDAREPVDTDKRLLASGERDRFFLGRAQRSLVSARDEPGRWEWHTYGVAYPDVTKRPNYLDCGDVLCEEGLCTSCGLDVHATVKDGVCPVCGSEVGLT